MYSGRVGLQSFSCVLLTDAYRIDMVWNEREWIDCHSIDIVGMLCCVVEVLWKCTWGV